METLAVDRQTSQGRRRYGISVYRRRQESATRCRRLRRSESSIWRSARNTVVAELGQVPNQPLHFADSKEAGRSEDDLIAYTRIKYIETHDETWLVRLAMVKSGIRAMDAMQEFLATDEAGKQKIERFVVAGGSKRGWTTWLIGAMDKRVVAIIPLVIDALEFRSHHAPSLRGVRLFFAGLERLCASQDLSGQGRHARISRNPENRGSVQLSRSRATDDSQVLDQRLGRSVLPARQFAVLLRGVARREAPALRPECQAQSGRERRAREPGSFLPSDARAIGRVPASVGPRTRTAPLR